MNFIDFTKKSVEALILLRKLIKMHEIVYVHCTAGIFRSPHLVILYLVKF
jgi:protein-tyrosine phosphatase